MIPLCGTVFIIKDIINEYLRIITVDIKSPLIEKEDDGR